MLKNLIFLIFLLTFTRSHATHVMGGELTWRCGGNGGYVFELVFYRDCNGAEVNSVSENLRVWNHPTLSSITVNFINRIDISPVCTGVPSGPQPLDCGNGAGGGTGIGSIEKITYRSSEIQMSGIPPAQGWILTYENFSRSNAVTNLTNPSSYGMTISATIFTASTANGCVDNSPQFLQAPYFVSCVGSPYVYNMNAVDPDLDSLFIEFSEPMNNFPAGTYNPPINPAPVPFTTGFAFSSPTPNAAISPGSVAAQLNSQNGELSFISNLQGNYVVKIRVSSYRQGVLIGRVEREMQLVLIPCSANNPPIIAGPFAGNSFTTTVDAGSLVNFNLLATDNGFLQNGTAQSVSITASGPMFGTNFTSSTGCAVSPCAFTTGLPATGLSLVSVPFTWQTDCAHLINAFGLAAESIPFYFVFKAQDDFCQVPKVTYSTIQINVRNPGIIQAPALNCISHQNGDYVLSWSPVANPNNSFVSYQIYSVQNGLIATLTSIGTNQFLVPEVQGNQDFYLGVVSGCNGSITKFSDTLHPIVLQLNNPLNGTAILQWNEPLQTNQSNLFYYIYQEYPLGVFQLIDSVPYGVEQYKDTIRICTATLGYQIRFPFGGCTFESNVPSDVFEDMITPAMPYIQSVGFDPNNNNALVVTWNQNSQPDTYGYVIYTYNSSNILYEIDTVWGWNSTSYTYNPSFDQGPLTYSVAAFDSCFTTSLPITYQTSAKAPLNFTIFLSGGINACAQQINLNWTAYIGQSVTGYKIYSFENNILVLLGSTTSLSAIVNVLGGNTYTIYVEAQLVNGQKPLSNPYTFTVPLPGQPLYHYLSRASVTGSDIEIKVYVEQAAGVDEVQIEKKLANGSFAAIGTSPVVGDFAVFTDTDVDVQNQSYTYRSRFIDTCGNVGSPSNEATSILTSAQSNEELQINYITWSPYIGFQLGVDHYEVYRIDPSGSAVQIGVVPAQQLAIEDSIDSGPYPGEICYFIEAHEILNSYAFQEFCLSNEVCVVYEPIIFVPNAFYPDGVNQIFKPVGTNIDPNNFKMTIFNRWSNVIFETTDYNLGWDGRFGSKNDLVPNDMYIYVLEFHDAAGNETIKRGHVNVIR